MFRLCAHTNIIETMENGLIYDSKAPKKHLTDFSAAPIRMLNLHKNKGAI
jgi:hypothetical protein